MVRQHGFRATGPQRPSLVQRYSVGAIAAAGLIIATTPSEASPGFWDFNTAYYGHEPAPAPVPLLTVHTLGVDERYVTAPPACDGTAVMVGYDDRYRQGGQLNARLFEPEAYQRTNRAVFGKVQYLYRY